jgi:hypothetical protein
MKRRESGGTESEPSTKKPNFDDKKNQFFDGAEYFLHSAALRETSLSENNQKFIYWVPVPGVILYIRHLLRHRILKKPMFG